MDCWGPMVQEKYLDEVDYKKYQTDSRRNLSGWNRYSYPETGISAADRLYATAAGDLSVLYRTDVPCIYGIVERSREKVLNDEIEKYASKVNLLDVLDRKVGTYSGGMKQRLLIAQAFLGDSKIIIFDEPTAGLDPKERIHVRNLIHDNSAGKIILIATHVVQDIEDIASQIMLLKKVC